MAADPTKDAVIRRRVLVSTISNYAGKIFALGIGFLMTPFLLHRLGASDYGLWVLVGSLVGYGALLDFGISSAITKYVSEYRARGQMQRAQTLVATGLALYSILGLLAFLLSIVLAPLFPVIFNLPPYQHEMAIRLVILSGLGLGISIPCTTPNAVLRGLQRFDILNVINATGTFLFFIATILVVLLGGGLLAIVAINIPLTLLMQIPSIWLIRKLAPELKFGWRGADFGLVRSVASYSSALFVTNIASQVQTKTDEIVIGVSMPVAYVTPYSIARRLSEMPQILTDQFMKVLMPLASQLHSEEDPVRLRALYLASTRLTLVGFVPLACGIIMLAQPFLTIWVGPAYGRYSYLVLILTIASLINTSQWPAASILQGMARHRRLAVMAAGSAVANLVLSLLLVGPLGLAGVALGTLIPTTVECLFFVLPYALRTIHVDSRQALLEMFLPAILPVIPMAFTLFFLQEIIDPSSFISIALIGGLSLIVYAGTYLAFGAKAMERQFIHSLVGNTLRTVRTHFFKTA
jgi:O-antigen/teichoic acid export membrane protein